MNLYLKKEKKNYHFILIFNSLIYSTDEYPVTDPLPQSTERKMGVKHTHTHTHTHTDTPTHRHTDTRGEAIILLLSELIN